MNIFRAGRRWLSTGARWTFIAILAVAIIVGGGRGFAAEPGSAITPNAVVTQYWKIVLASYKDALAAAETLRARIDEFLAEPGEARLAAARAAWIDAHVVYSLTEAYRFYEGPIDNGINGPEARINGWPMDEVYVDYVAGRPDGGIINDPARYPFLDGAALAELNERGGEESIATGYHAIEFLLWGQDRDPNGAGARSWKDYVAEGSAAHADRRTLYLKSISKLLVDDLGRVVNDWDPANTYGYAKGFLEDAKGTSLAGIFTGIGRMASDELAGERMFVPFDTGNQEDEQSCFSDTTHLALLANADGIRNVYMGTYQDLKGPSLSDLVRQANPAADDAVRDAIKASREAIAAIPAPLDRVITAERDNPVRKTLFAAVEAVEHEAQMIVAAARVIGIKLNLNVGGEK